MSNAKQYIKLEFSTLENTDLSYSEMIMLSYIKGFEVLYNIKPETMAEKLSMKLSTVKANITSLKKKGLWLQARNLDSEDRNLDEKSRNLDSEDRNLDEKSRNLDEKSRNLAIITPVSPMKTTVLLDNILETVLEIKLDNKLENQILDSNSAAGAASLHKNQSNTVTLYVDKQTVIIKNIINGTVNTDLNYKLLNLTTTEFKQQNKEAQNTITKYLESLDTKQIRQSLSTASKDTLAQEYYYNTLKL